MIERLDWKEVNWDPFSGPWWSPKKTRYVYKQRWMDLEELKALFWEKRKEIDEQYTKFVGDGDSYHDYSEFEDEGAWVEEHIRELSQSNWTDEQRKRVRPVEMYYPVWQRSLFALFNDGRYIELTDEMPMSTQYQIIMSAQEVVSSIVRKMRVCSFFGDVELQEMASPFPHDDFPLVPLVGYIDRYGFPYGIPMQVEGMQEEVNKRRSMAMALLKSRRVMAETDAADDADGLDRLYEEANKLDGFMKLKSGAIGQNKFKIVENAELAPSQVALMSSTENEINEIVGANLASMGYESNETSGVAIQSRAKQTGIVIARVFENLRRSMKRVGDQTTANIQGYWKAEKVLRITDRLTGAERFVEINKKIQTEDGSYSIKNNISQAKFDTIVSESPQTDTVREKNMEMIIEAVKKSPPEVIPHLMITFFELSSLPNKQQILAKIQPLLGVSPEDEEMSHEERKAKVLKELEAQQQQQQKETQVQDAGIQLELEGKELENEKIQAEIDEIRSRIKTNRAKTVSDMKKKLDDTKIKRAGTVIDLKNAQTQRWKVAKEGEKTNDGTASNQGK
jgi:Fe-S-cluster formation regulator IscX/YfhJ